MKTNITPLMIASIAIAGLASPAKAGYAAGAYAYVHQSYTTGGWANVWYAAGEVVNYPSSSSATNAAQVKAYNKLPYQADYYNWLFYSNGRGYAATATGSMNNLVVVSNAAYKYSTRSGAVNAAVKAVKKRGATQWVYVSGYNS